MANMSYCRFENTLLALQDCHEHMFDSTKGMSEEEQAARLEMFSEIHRMARELSKLDKDTLINGDPDI